MSYGVTNEGFAGKSLEELKAALEAAFQAVFGASIDLSPQSIFGQWIGIAAEQLAEGWATGESIYTALSPDGATGASLDLLCGLTGTARRPASLTHVLALLSGTPATVLPIGRTVRTFVVDDAFVTDSAATIVAATAWAATTGYLVGDRRTATGAILECAVSGTSAASAPALPVLGALVTDGTVTWRCIGLGSGLVEVAVTAVVAGPKAASAGALTVIGTPVAGWSSVYNTAGPTVLGSEVETDAALRIRRELELQGAGSSPWEALRSALSRVLNVTRVYLYTNVTDAVDVNGLPPHSVEAVVTGGTDAAVTAALWNGVAAGIQTFGSSSAVVTDSQGDDHTIYFTRPTTIPIYVSAVVVVDPALWPADGADQVKAALVAYGAATYTNGWDVVASALSAQAFQVPGVLDSWLPLIGTSLPLTVSINIPINPREIAALDVARIALAVI